MGWKTKCLGSMLYKLVNRLNAIQSKTTTILFKRKIDTTVSNILKKRSKRPGKLFFFKLISRRGSVKMAEQVKACAAKPDDLSLTLKREVERESRLPQVVLCSLHVPLVCTQTLYTYTYRNQTKIKIKSIRNKTTCFLKKNQKFVAHSHI